jgi:hypothetical protein
MEIVSKSLKKNLKTIPGQYSIHSVQKAAIPGTTSSSSLFYSLLQALTTPTWNITHHKESATI